MGTLIRVLLVFHFLGLAMGFASGLSGMVMSRLAASASPADRAVLARFPPLMSRVGDIGLALLWVTGLSLLYTKWNGFGSMPGLFHAKITAVVVLTGLVGYIHMLMGKARRGDTAAMQRIPVLGRFALLTAVTIVVLAVFTFA